MLEPLILIAEDEKTTQQMLRLSLEGSGYRVDMASDGREAVDKTRQLMPDLILMDINMPIMSGFDAIKLLREEATTSRIPIIVLTASQTMSHDAAHGINLGADDYLRKPFNLDELNVRISSKIRAYHLEERLRQRTAELEALTQIGAQLNEALALNELADRLIAITQNQINSTCAGLALIGADGVPTLTVVQPAEFAQADTLRERLLGNGTLLAHVLKTGEPILINDVPSNDILTILAGSGCKAGIAAPLVHRGQILGAVLLAHRDAKHYAEEDLRVLRSIGEQAALAVRNAQLYAELQGYAHGLEQMVEVRTTALQHAQEQLTRAEKLAGIGTLAAGIAHEVNNPLLPVLMCLELILENVDEGEPIDREMIEVAVREVRRIQTIVAGLLEFARPDQKGMTLVSINEVLDEVMALSRKQLEHTEIRINTELAVLPNVEANGDQLKQVILNLVLNAMEAMPNGGNLTLRSFEEGAFVALSVQDTGIGIAQEHLVSIFDPFFTTKAEGTGLGLAISHTIIEGHGGKIDVSSAESQGTRFTIRLPKAVETPQAVRAN